MRERSRRLVVAREAREIVRFVESALADADAGERRLEVMERRIARRQTERAFIQRTAFLPTRPPSECLAGHEADEGGVRVQVQRAIVRRHCGVTLPRHEEGAAEADEAVRVVGVERRRLLAGLEGGEEVREGLLHALLLCIRVSSRVATNRVDTQKELRRRPTGMAESELRLEGDRLVEVCARRARVLHRLAHEKRDPALRLVPGAEGMRRLPSGTKSFELEEQRLQRADDRLHDLVLDGEDVGEASVETVRVNLSAGFDVVHGHVDADAISLGARAPFDDVARSESAADVPDWLPPERRGAGTRW